VARLLNPLGATAAPALAAAVNLALIGAVNLGLMFAIGIIVGCVESLTARLQLKAVPTYLMVASLLGLLALLTGAWDGSALQ